MFHLLILLSLFLTGCSGFNNSRAKSTPADNSRNKVASLDIVIPAEPPKTSGSLWSEHSNHGFLYGDIKARQVGDIVTIKVDEDAKGSKDATTKTKKDSSIFGGIDVFFGLPAANRGIKASTKNEFTGTGSTSRSGKLTANVTATIMRVLPNGNMIISGERRVLINDEEQIIKVTGTIRSDDINSSNQVLSTHIANANIEYTGKGIFEERQRPGWGSRLFDIIWPF